MPLSTHGTSSVYPRTSTSSSSDHVPGVDEYASWISAFQVEDAHAPEPISGVAIVRKLGYTDKALRLLNKDLIDRGQLSGSEDSDSEDSDVSEPDEEIPVNSKLAKPAKGKVDTPAEETIYYF
jgi:hypothetical protein